MNNPISQKPKSGHVDYTLSVVIFALIVIGLVMISSASVVVSYEISGENYFFLKRQLIYALIGLVVWIVTTLVDYRFWRKHALTIMIISLLLLGIVLLPYFSSETHGANRWIAFGPFSFQPSELAKLALLIYLAGWLARRKEQLASLFSGFVPFIIIIAVVIFLIMMEPDLGTASIIAASAAIVFFVSGANLLYLLLGGGLGVFVVLSLILSAPYRLSRLLSFLNPGADPQGAGYQIRNALIAIGSGGLWGLGFGNSRQKYLYLPEAHTDSIFAVITEELGFVRAIVILILFVILAYRGYKIAKEAPDDFSRLLAVGITSWFVIQAFVNLSAMLGLVPLTGIPLPFISYGGSSLIISLAAVGILLNISKYRIKRENR